ncbi:hypothetical protein PTT_16130 [Pyrenophora teres f. teres 0-1]|uniref:Uncharacterized protein n=1 Tax=Pyrenophora teres f. teres (strain 0-1) TaxID=861557 RepID=E3S1M5_PYRTT|nr:hypothetical protein PTT_16130 [Pyrenophora teres f. teres 0-1]
MLAQQAKQIDITCADSGRTSPSRKREKSPTTFMFIDSSKGGVNAKPDKVVRSFVMKSARNKKSWSTRPKSSKSESTLNAKASRGSLCPYNAQPQASISHAFECGSPLMPLEKWTTTSRSSSRSNSVFSSNSSDWTGNSPVSTYTSPCAENNYADDAFNFPSTQRPSLPSRNTLFIRSLGSFDCLSVQLDTKTKYLLQQFVKVTTPRLLPIDPHRSSEAAATEWIAACIQSPVGAPFVYAALTSASRATKLDTEAYKWRAISEVNRLLSDPSKNTNDTTIATVLILLALEEADLADPRRNGDDRRCSVSVSNAHLSGLRTMIAQRGGLAALNGNRCLQVFILMHSIAQSITTFKRPYALLSTANGQTEDYVTLSSNSAHSFTNMLRQFHNLGIDRGLFKVISTMAVFISDLTSWYDTGTCPVDPLDLQKHASLLLYRLFNWYDNNQYGLNQRDNPQSTVSESICLALMIFMVIATEPNAQPLGCRLSRVTTKLHDTLQHVPNYKWSNAPDLLFWTLTIGALGAKSMTKGFRANSGQITLPYFTQYCRNVVGPQVMFSGDEMLGRVKSCLWVPCIFDERAKRLWTNMGLCKAEVLDVEDTSTSSEGEREQIDDEYALGQSTAMRFFGDGRR